MSGQGCIRTCTLARFSMVLVPAVVNRRVLSAGWVGRDPSSQGVRHLWFGWIRVTFSSDVTPLYIRWIWVGLAEDTIPRRRLHLGHVWLGRQSVYTARANWVWCKRVLERIRRKYREARSVLHCASLALASAGVMIIVLSRRAGPAVGKRIDHPCLLLIHLPRIPPSPPPTIKKEKDEHEER